MLGSLLAADWFIFGQDINKDLVGLRVFNMVLVRQANNMIVNLAGGVYGDLIFRQVYFGLFTQKILLKFLRP